MSTSKHKQVDYLVTGDHSPEKKLDLNVLNSPHIIQINFKSMKILSNNMPSIHKIYEYGNIAIEELFDIGSTQNARFSQNSLFLLFKTGKCIGDSSVFEKPSDIRTCPTF